MKLNALHATALAATLLASTQVVAQTTPAAAPAAAPEAEAYGAPSRDTQVWYRIQPDSKEPGLNKDNDPKKGKSITKQLLHFEHTDTGGWIWNSFSVTALISNHVDPAKDSSSGAQEIYATYRGDISATGFGKAPISAPGIKDIQFEFGGDVNSKNTAYAPGRRFLLLGPNFVFDVPGSVNLAVHFAKEWNHNGFAGKYDDYHPTLNTELSYTQYLDFTGLPLRLEGVFNVTLPKGTTLPPRGSGLAGAKTVTEYYTYNSIILDLGQVINWRPHTLDLITGIQVWWNKFGNSMKNDGGAFEAAPYFGIGIHF